MVCPDLDCLMVPKVESAETLARVSTSSSTDWSASAGIPRARSGCCRSIETALGLVRCEEIALSAPARVVTLDLRPRRLLGRHRRRSDPRGDRAPLRRARGSSSPPGQRGLPAPIDGPYLDIHDLDGLVENTLLSRRLGFQGRVVVYPAQVEPGPARVLGALRRRSSSRRDASSRRSRRPRPPGLASIQVDGRFIDYPLYYRARQRLRLHDALVARSAGT